MRETKRERCANCGDWTTFANAIGPREKLKWCSPCYKVYEKNRTTDGAGKTVWLERRGLYDDRGRGLRERESTE